MGTELKLVVVAIAFIMGCLWLRLKPDIARHWGTAVLFAMISGALGSWAEPAPWFVLTAAAAGSVAPWLITAGIAALRKRIRKLGDT